MEIATTFHRKLDAVGTEGLDVRVVEEADAPERDDPQVRSGLRD